MLNKFKNSVKIAFQKIMNGKIRLKNTLKRIRKYITYHCDILIMVWEIISSVPKVISRNLS